ncbi:hypothetical protein [Actinotalea sp.]
MFRILKPATVAVLTVALAVFGLPISGSGATVSIGTGCCKQ